MKVIDFLVELEKGNIPEKIIYNNHVYCYEQGSSDYLYEGQYFIEDCIRGIDDLSEEIMIINDNLVVAQNEVNRLMDTIKKVNEDLDKLRRSINNE